MANAERGEVDLVNKHTGKTYTLFLSTAAICEMEERTGKTYGEMLTAVMSVSIKALTEMTHAVLQKHHAKEFPDRPSVKPLIDDVGFKVAKDAMLTLFTRNHPTAEDEPKGGDRPAAGSPPDAQAGTGDSST